MFDFNAGAKRPVNEDARAKRLRDAQGLVQRTLAQHGLASPSNPLSPVAAPGLGGLLRTMLPNGPGQAHTGTTKTLFIPDGAQFLSASHQGRSGNRAYRTYVPASAHTGVEGIVMMLHGCTQTPEDFALGTGMNALAERHRLIVLYPEQLRGANAQSCWNWFSPNDQRRERGEPEILAGIAQTAMAQHCVSPDRTFVAGLSAGAAMAVILGHTYPDVFAAVGAHSGLPYGAASDVASAFAAMAGQSSPVELQPPSPGVRTIVFHGAADSTVHPTNGAAIAMHAERHGPTQSVQTTQLGSTSSRSYTKTISTDPDQRAHLEHWVIDGLGHAWSGGQQAGTYTDPNRPDASAEMVRFFLETKD